MRIIPCGIRNILAKPLGLLEVERERYALCMQSGHVYFLEVVATNVSNLSGAKSCHGIFKAMQCDPISPLGKSKSETQNQNRRSKLMADK